MISIILWAIAPMFNAIMDLIENENFFQSIFYRNPAKYPPDSTAIVSAVKWNNWWYKRASAQTVKLIYGYRPDAWHLSKSIMFILFACSLVVGIYFEEPMFHIKSMHTWGNALLDITLRLLWWDVSFSMFYDTLFRRKTWIKN